MPARAPDAAWLITAQETPRSRPERSFYLLWGVHHNECHLDPRSRKGPGFKTQVGRARLAAGQEGETWEDA